MPKFKSRRHYFEVTDEHGCLTWKDENSDWEFDVYNPALNEDGSLRNLIAVFVKNNRFYISMDLLTGERTFTYLWGSIEVPKPVINAANVVLRRVMARRTYIEDLTRCFVEHIYQNSAHNISPLDTVEDYQGKHHLYGRPQRWVRDWFERIENF